jgi:Na+/H+ antiporter NhaC
MANSTRFLQTAKNRIPFLKNVSTNFILLASLFIISIVIYYMFNKNSLENMDNENDNGSDNGSDKLLEGLPRGTSPLARLADRMNKKNARNDAITRTSR